MAIEFPDDVKNRMLRALGDYALEHFDRELGELQSAMLFEFTVNLVGAAAYNQAIQDAHAYLAGKLTDLEIDLHEKVEYETP